MCVNNPAPIKGIPQVETDPATAPMIVIRTPEPVSIKAVTTSVRYSLDPWSQGLFSMHQG